MLREKFEGQINEMRKSNRSEFKNAEERLDRLQTAIAQEVDDRVTETDAKINQTKETLDKLQSGFDTEVNTRIEREKFIRQEIDDSKYDLQKKIDYERTDKSLKLGAFRDDTNNQLKK